MNKLVVVLLCAWIFGIWMLVQKLRVICKRREVKRQQWVKDRQDAHAREQRAQQLQWQREPEAHIARREQARLEALRSSFLRRGQDWEKEHKSDMLVKIIT